jgi:hypothetical protein
MSFQDLSNDTTLIQIQTGRTEPFSSVLTFKCGTVMYHILVLHCSKQQSFNPVLFVISRFNFLCVLSHFKHKTFTECCSAGNSKMLTLFCFDKKSFDPMLLCTEQF